MVSVNDEVPYTEENEDGVGDVKKLGIIIVIIALLRIGSFVYYESKLLEEPVVVSTEYHEEMGVIIVRYITNRSAPEGLAWIEIGDQAFGPDSFYEEVMYDPYLSNANLQQEYTYYSLYQSHVAVPGTSEMESIEIPDFATIYFTAASNARVPIGRTLEQEQETPTEDWINQYVREAQGK